MAELKASNMLVRVEHNGFKLWGISRRNGLGLVIYFPNDRHYNPELSKVFKDIEGVDVCRVVSSSIVDDDEVKNLLEKSAELIDISETEQGYIKTQLLRLIP